MIRSGNFEPTQTDICTMAFPRIDIPDDPNWIPRGLAFDDVKHPGAAFSRWFHSRWDGARWDVLTFLRLRKPARTSGELLSYVSIMERGADAGLENGLDELLTVHEGMLAEFRNWRRMVPQRDKASMIPSS